MRTIYRVQGKVGLTVALFGIFALGAGIVLRLRAQQNELPFWTSIDSPVFVHGNRGVSNNAGRVASLAVDPQNPSHWLAGFGNGGLWESRDAGANWTSLSDSWPSLAIGAVAFAPGSPNTIYVGTGEADGAGLEHTGTGIMKSTDAGRTWSLISSPTFTRASIKRVRVNPANSALLCAATLRGGYGRNSTESVPGSPPFGIFRSADGGATWAR